MKHLALILSTLLSLEAFCQTHKIDSLRIAFINAKKDTTRTSILNAISYEFRNSNPDSSVYYARQALSIAQKIKFPSGEADSYLLIGSAYHDLGKNDDAILLLTRAKRLYEKINLTDKKEAKKNKKNFARTFNSLGNVYSTLGNYSLSLKNHRNALTIRQEIGDKAGLAASYNNIGIIYKDQGNYAEALKNQFASLKIKESLNNKPGMAIAYNNIGNIYNDQGNNEQALMHLRNSLKIAKEINLSNIITTCYMNIGAIYASQKRFDEALKSYMEAYEIAKKDNNKEAISDLLGNIGSVYSSQGKYDEALKHEYDALKLKEELEDYSNISYFQNNIAKIFLMKGDNAKALNYGVKALELARKTNNIKQIQESSLNLIIIYKNTGNYKKAFEMQELYHLASDSMLSNSNQREVMRQEFQYNYQKQTIADSLNYVSQKKITELENQAKLKTERNKLVNLSIGLAIIAIFAAFIFNRFRVTQKQKNIIEKQSKKLTATHNQLAQKTKEINDSIQYSKEIQNTFLKSPADSKKYFKDVVLVYKPKDVVSGDFYWYKELDDKLFVVVGDSTGHGVPGAIISVLAIQSLEKTIPLVKNNNELHLLNEMIRDEFNTYYKTDGHVSIGLDYSIICIDKKSNKLYISGSGANILIKTQNELSSFKFDTINIGGNIPAIYDPKTVTLDLSTIKSVFLYTDGIVDQKGTETGKKFGTKKLKNLIETLNTNDAQLATKKIEDEINNWIGNSEQIDDITILGIQTDQA